MPPPPSHNHNQGGLITVVPNGTIALNRTGSITFSGDLLFDQIPNHDPGILGQIYSHHGQLMISQGNGYPGHTMPPMPGSHVMPDTDRTPTELDNVMAGRLSTLWPLSGMNPQDSIHIAIAVNDMMMAAMQTIQDLKDEIRELKYKQDDYETEINILTEEANNYAYERDQALEQVQGFNIITDTYNQKIDNGPY